MRVTFDIDTKMAKYLSEIDIGVEDLFLLKCVYTNNWDLVNLYLGNKTLDQKYLTFSRLVRKQLLKIEYEDLLEFSEDNYTLTKDGVGVIFYFEEVLKVQEEIREVILLGNGILKGEQLEEKTKFDEFIEKFRNKFPEGKNGGGVRFKGNFVDIKNKMHKFMNKYKYPMDVILIATDNYLKGFKSKGFEYCSAAQYFISKDKESQLGAWCEEVVEKKDKGESGDSSVNPFLQLM